MEFNLQTFQAYARMRMQFTGFNFTMCAALLAVSSELSIDQIILSAFLFLFAVFAALITQKIQEIIRYTWACIDSIQDMTVDLYPSMEFLISHRSAMILANDMKAHHRFWMATNFVVPTLTAIFLLSIGVLS